MLKTNVCGNQKYLSELNIEESENLQSTLDTLRYEGKASIIVGLNGRTVGVIGLSDMIREDAGDMIEALHKLDTETILLTGDHKETADYFASKVGIKDVRGELLPEDKLTAIEDIKKSGRQVCMIGDGVNDAPALKASDVSVAMGTMGSDVAIDAADVALLGDDIGKIPYLKRLSNSTLFTIRFNIALSMCINAVAIICSVLGLLNPVTGAIVHNAGSCLVVLNAALLYDRKFDEEIKEDSSNEVLIENNSLNDSEKIIGDNLEHIHMHTHKDGEHSHSHEGVDIINEIETPSGIRHSHAHTHEMKFQRACDAYRNNA